MGEAKYKLALAKELKVSFILVSHDQMASLKRKVVVCFTRTNRLFLNESMGDTECIFS